MELEYLTLSQLLERAASQYPDHPALEYKEEIYTYRQMNILVDRYALSLLELGVQPGEHVGILCEAEPNAVIASYAVTRIGGVVVMLNTSLGRQELMVRLQKADVRYLLIGDGYKELCYPQLCMGMEAQVPCLTAISYIGQSTCDPFPQLRPALVDADFSGVQQRAGAVRPEDTAYVLFTSGTGSTPKAVMSSHYSRVNSGIQQAKDLAATCEDRFCIAMPIFHCFSLSVNVFAACAVGACLYLPESRRTSALLQAVSKGRCTILSCVPALFRALLKRPDLEQWDLSSLRTGFIGGSTYPESLFEEIERRMGMTLLSSLGQTEATAGITTASLQDPLLVRANTVGHFMDHVEGKICDLTTGEKVPQGSVGEICVRGYVVMQGYYGQPEETAKVIDTDGWLHTGDVGYLDEAGNLHLEGRLKELIIRGGENISPREIEAVLFDDPRISACKAVGVPDEHYGEGVCLCVVPAQHISETDIRDKLEKNLASFKIPKYILFLECFPTTSTGKILLQELKDMASRIIQENSQS